MSFLRRLQSGPVVAVEKAADDWADLLDSIAKRFEPRISGAFRAAVEEMRGKIPSDYGRSMGIAWYYLGGFGIVHTAAAQARIVKWDSAA